MTADKCLVQLYISIITAWPVPDDLPPEPAARNKTGQHPDAVASAQHSQTSATRAPPATAESISSAIASSALAVAISRVLAATLGVHTAYLAFVALIATALGAAGRQLQSTGLLFAGT